MNLSPFYGFGDNDLDDMTGNSGPDGDGKSKMRHGCALILNQAREEIVSGCQNNKPDSIDSGLSMLCPIFRCALVNTGLPCADNCNANLGELGNLLQE